MSEYQFCAKCLETKNSLDLDMVYTSISVDIGDQEHYRCPVCKSIDDLEEIDPKWALRQITNVYKQLQLDGNSRSKRFAARLKAAEDELIAFVSRYD